MDGQVNDEPLEEPGFRVDGRNYEVPPIDTFTFGELETLYAYTGLTIYDWGRRHTDDGAERWTRAASAPSFNMCLVHVAYRRGNPELPDDTVAELVKGLHWLDVIEPLMSAEDDDQGEALGATSAPDRSSETRPSESELSKPDSGPSSPNGSTERHDPPSSPPVTTGTGELGTSHMSDLIGAPI